MEDPIRKMIGKRFTRQTHIQFKTVLAMTETVLTVVQADVQTAWRSFRLPVGHDRRSSASAGMAELMIF
jgi:hypothetical protein